MVHNNDEDKNNHSNDNPWDDDFKEDESTANKHKKKVSNEESSIHSHHNNRHSPEPSIDLKNIIENLFQNTNKPGPSEKKVFEFSNYFDKKKSGHSGPPHEHAPKKVFFLIAGMLTAIWLGSGVYRVQETETAIVLRFGKLLSKDPIGPGLHYRLPYPFEEEIVKNVTENRIMDSTKQIALNRVSETGLKSDPTLVLTGDENILHVSYTVTWKINDVPEYVYATQTPEDIVLSATESVIREVVGQSSALDILTDQRASVSTKATELLQKILAEYKMGVEIIRVELQKAEPPREIVAAFNDMQASLTDGDSLRIKADAYRSEVVPKARGEASQIIQKAEGYAAEVIAREEGNAERFKMIYQKYLENKSVVSQSLYIDAMDSVLSKTKKKIVDLGSGKTFLPHLDLSSNQNTQTHKKK
ncbi:MAG: FtsH protease activity modulator HflK [Candidatus Puniceispirillum sp.]|nr:FtsH protease activity modulator HflK [Candidatus Pelagibacter sp.]MBA4283583.1 FtsH protease activity modulator HflK [Candidatus Puniceispirillum sp.]